MTKQDHIDYWKRISDSDWQATQHLFENEDYLQSLFFAHLVLEKLLKSHWVKDNPDNYPPRIHRLKSLMEKTDLILTSEEINILDDMEIFQLEGRYPDYHNKIGQLCTQERTQSFLENVERVRQSLLKKLL